MQQRPDRLTRLMSALDAADPEGSDSERSDPEGLDPGGLDPAARHRQQPRLVTLPAALRSARLRVRPSAVLGAAVLLLGVLAVLGVRAAWAQRTAEPDPVPVSATSDVGAPSNPAVVSGEEAAGGEQSARGKGAAAVETSGEGAPERLLVHVIGGVAAPGVVDVPGGARVRDVVVEAGGLSSDADPARLNLARVVLDGERLWVPTEGDDPPEEVLAQVPAAASGGGTALGSGDPTEDTDGVDASEAPVDLNHADSALLQTLPGVGPVTAEAILAWRTEQGRFTAVEELMEVSGIGPRTLEKLSPHVVIGP